MYDADTDVFSPVKSICTKKLDGNESTLYRGGAGWPGLSSALPLAGGRSRVLPTGGECGGWDREGNLQNTSLSEWGRSLATTALPTLRYFWLELERSWQISNSDQYVQLSNLKVLHITYYILVLTKNILYSSEVWDTRVWGFVFLRRKSMNPGYVNLFYFSFGKEREIKRGGVFLHFRINKLK